MGMFEAGDRVVLCIDRPYGNGHLFAGMRGTVVYADDHIKNNAVCFDGFTHGHDCWGHATEPNSGWWLHDEDIEPLPDECDPEAINEADIADEAELFSFIGI